MQKVMRFFATAGFSIILFFLSFSLFNWPMLSAVHNGHPRIFFVYLFLVWALVILLLFLMVKGDSGD